MFFKGVDEGSTISSFKPKTQALTNIILAAMYENGKQHKAESPGFKLKKFPVAIAELTNVDFGSTIDFGLEVVPEVFKQIV